MTDLERVRDYHATQAKVWIRFAETSRLAVVNRTYVYDDRREGAQHIDREAAHHARLAATWQRYVDLAARIQGA